MSTTSFITAESFDNVVRQNRPNDIGKQSDVPVGDIFKICTVQERVIHVNGGSKNVRYASLENANGERKNVWLTSLIEKELENHNIDKENAYIRSLGKRSSKVSKRDYYAFDIVTLPTLQMKYIRRYKFYIWFC